MVALCLEMSGLLWYLCPALLLSTLAISHSAEHGSWSARKGVAQVFPGSLDTQQSSSHGGQQGGGRHCSWHGNRVSAGLLSHRPLHPVGSDDGMSLGGLSPVGPQMDPGGRGRVGRQRGETPSAFRIKSHVPTHHSIRTEHARKGRRHGHHPKRRKQGGRRTKTRHSKDHFSHLELGSVQHREVFEERPSGAPPSESTALPSLSTIVSTSPSTPLVTTVMTEQWPTGHRTSTTPQRFGQRKKPGEVMPTLDMTLFDWTDYEDMRPADSWPSSKKKDKWRSNYLNNGNMTTDTDTVEPCDHHLDCLSGSCCDLRHHECRTHNRGLNNKCYDDCMCTEGLRCYAKFHHNRRVTRRKGRCVEPESANMDQGAFISV
ncbi:hypothetical protein AGOR_G00155070 [Albula goreensis]|uniref:Dorsal repulsive axon guidance protein n=1 Tax=Albula goreensis TaxID=1534307 RepID=A0A8T3CZ17_9TELE|nr:hypothetical protein AGOR_G00155070 [Albula goreensis]